LLLEVITAPDGHKRASFLVLSKLQSQKLSVASVPRSDVSLQQNNENISKSINKAKRVRHQMHGDVQNNVSALSDT
jgi:hypothetical protein